MPGPPAATWMDLVVGVDVHAVLVPTPAGPIPTPLPHPHVGLAGDPVGAAVAAAVAPLMSLCLGGPIAPPAGPVLVNGLPKMTTADLSRNTPLLAHTPMPPGTAFARPPSGEGTHDFGSKTVVAGGASVVRLGEVVMSCSDPLPLPTATVVTIPKGHPVLVGGPPGADLAKAIENAVVGRAIRTVWGAASAAFKFAGRFSSARLRTWLDKARCFFTGHPVDIVSGSVVTDARDFDLGGDPPFAFERAYSSAWAARSGPLGHGWSHSFDRALWFEPDGVVARVGDGRELVFDTSAHEKGIPIRGEVRDPITGYTLERVKADLWRVIHPDGMIDELTPIRDDPDPAAAISGLCRVIRTIRRQGRDRLEYLYSRGRLVAVIDGHGRLVKFRHDQHGRLAAVSLPSPEEADVWIEHVVFTYSDDGDLIEARDAIGHVTRYGYAAHLLVKETRRNGVTFFWAYDGMSSRARCIRTWGRNGDEIMFNQKILYDPANRRTVVLDSYGNATAYTANELNLVVQVRDPHGHVTSLDYDQNLKLTAETDPLGNVGRTSYDRFGRPQTTLAADGARTVRKYHSRFPELETFFCDECGGIWRRDYDQTGRLRQLRGPDTGVRRELFWRDGLLVAVEEAGERRTELTYDNRRFLSTVTQPTGARHQYEYDRRGRVVKIVGPTGARTAFHYDSLDRLVRSDLPDGDFVEQVYDPEGNVVEERTTLGTIRFTYRNFDKVGSREEGGDRETFVWGQEGELREVRNALNQPYVFEYDAPLRVSREIDFDLQRVTYKRDAAGRLARRSTAGAHTDFKYDPLGRLTEQKHTDGTWSAFQYRADGQLVRAENQTVAVTLERDALGRVIRDRQGDQWVRTTYFHGQAATVDSSLGAHMSILRDDAGTLKRIALGDPRGSQAEIRFSYDLDGLEVGRELPGGAAVAVLRDVVGRPRQQTLTTRDGQWSRRYEWQHDRLAGMDDSHFGTSTFRYDTRGRPVIAAFGPAKQIRAQDAVGNVYRTLDMSDRSYARGGRIRETPTERFGFGPDGALATRVDASAARWSYRWSGDGTLREVERPDGATVAFAYDALGRRVSKRVGDVETRWVWNGDTVLHEVTNAGDATWYHEPGTYTPLAVYGKERQQFVVADHLGTPAAAIDDAGQFAWTMQLDLFGVPRRDAPGDAPPWRWPGQYADSDAGLYYNRFRYYDSDLGQYLSKDPIGLAGGLAPFSYVPDPLTWIDAIGLAAANELPPFKGRAHSWIRRQLERSGFSQTRVSAIGNEEWDHADGSQVLLHPYGDAAKKRWKTANNAHVHKYVGARKLSDYGFPSGDPNRTHIGLPNPPNLPLVRSRSHGCGAK